MKSLQRCKKSIESLLNNKYERGPRSSVPIRDLWLEWIEHARAKNCTTSLYAFEGLLRDFGYTLAPVRGDETVWLSLMGYQRKVKAKKRRMAA